MTKRVIHPPSSTWPSDQGVDSDRVIGDADEVIAYADDPARVLLSRLFGPSIPRTLLEQDVATTMAPKAVDVVMTMRRSVDLVARLEAIP